MLALEQEGFFRVVTLKRPEVRNAFNAELIGALQTAFREASSDAAVRAIYLKGEGAVFSAGADLTWMRAMGAATEEENVRDARTLSGLFEAMHSSPKPIVCAVQGAAMGGGLGLVAASDIAIASEDAVFALSEVALGLIPAVISPYVIRKIGVSAASRYFLTAERFSAADANAMGLVHQVVKADVLDSTARGVLAAISRAGPEAVAGAKALIDAVSGSISESIRDYTCRAIARHRVSQEGQEGMAAFLEKRKPKWISQ